MLITRVIKPSFSVIGKEGSTQDGSGFIPRLWREANAHFKEIAPLVKRDENGIPVGFWGVMSDFSRNFDPWEDGFTKGLYLAGAECPDNAEAPEGWRKWTVPGYEYVMMRCEGDHPFADLLDYLQTNGLTPVGAVHDFTDPKTGQNYQFAPVRRLD